jgi:hypothetical protein
MAIIYRLFRMPTAQPCACPSGKQRTALPADIAAKHLELLLSCGF